MERKWKKDKLQVSCEILKDCMVTYQQFKSAKTPYFSDLISKNHHSPKVLLRAINTVLHPVFPTVVENAGRNCEMFLKFFMDKITDIRASISNFPLVPG